MEYNVNFIGLSYFEPLVGGSRRVLMPDGRIPPADIQPHWASIVIDPAVWVTDSGWQPSEISKGPMQYEYFFPPSSLVFPTTAPTPNLDTTQLDPLLISLRSVDFRFVLSSAPMTAAVCTMRHGSVAALNIPNTGPGPVTERQYFARWTIPQAGDDPITIVVQELRGWPIRTLTIAARSDVSVINSSRDPQNALLTGDHFRLYERLSGVEVDLTLNTQSHNVLTAFTGNLPRFTSPLPATGEISCSPTKP